MARPRSFDHDTALDAAAELFWSHGYEGTSMSDLEVALDMGRQSIYNAFGDKHALFIKALERYTSWNRERLAALLLAPDAGLGTITSFFEGMVEVSAKDGRRRGCLVANSILEVGGADEDIAKSCEVNQTLVLRGFENALANAVSEGEVSESLDVKATARALMSHTYGLSVLSKAGMPIEELAGSTRALLAMLG